MEKTIKLDLTKFVLDSKRDPVEYNFTEDIYIEKTEEQKEEEERQRVEVGTIDTRTNKNKTIKSIGHYKDMQLGDAIVSNLARGTNEEVSIDETIKRYSIFKKVSNGGLITSVDNAKFTEEEIDLIKKLINKNGTMMYSGIVIGLIDEQIKEQTNKQL